MKRILFLLLLLGLVACSFYIYGEKDKQVSEDTILLYKKIKQVESIHKKMEAPRPGDWLYEHHENGQTFKEYLKCNPVIPDKQRNILYIQPLGNFTEKQREIIQLSAEFMGLYFDLKVKVVKDLPLTTIPSSARRKRFGSIQILSTYVLDDLLYPRLPKDAAAYIAFTASDLWPGRGWNFVFGQASLRQRVGVWSIHRYGSADLGENAFRKLLSRTLKTATHETGHMFSLQHCTAWECNLNGSNSLTESDKKPLWLCPECLTKICWARKIKPETRLKKLAKFCETYKLVKEQNFFLKEIELLKKVNK